ncbi:metallothionein-I transcription activator [Hypoxylon rubiginosum]|uniref:Metallothionein-I transcription activator n=1 Tax=Hypoxylon rubiginosum TaxID=110542 RepID=A0ACC0D0V5_9PEZI|nr:metallothionein-I transcription activator [Hypoxylon rubiginosum]
MSREAYQIPTGSQGAPGGPGGAGQRAPFDMDATNVIIKYICGDCGTDCPLRRNEPIRCKDCGCRVLYKERTKKMVQFEAR